MSHGTIVVDHAGALHALRLTLPGYFELDRSVDGGVAGLIARLRQVSFSLADIQAAFRILLRGGGVPAVAAESVVRRFSLRDIETAADIVGAAVAASLLPPKGEDMPSASGDGEDVSSGEIYATGFAIGLKPREVDDLTAWEFSRCVAGWNLARGGEEKPEAPKQDEMAELFAKYG